MHDWRLNSTSSVFYIILYIYTYILYNYTLQLSSLIGSLSKRRLSTTIVNQTTLLGFVLKWFTYNCENLTILYTTAFNQKLWEPDPDPDSESESEPESEPELEKEESLIIRNTTNEIRDSINSHKYYKCTSVRVLALYSTYIFYLFTGIKSV